MNTFPKKWKIYDKTLYLEKHDVLIVSDIHLGICNSNEFDTKYQYHQKYKRLNNIINQLNPQLLILNGDTFYNIFDETNPLKEDELAINILRKWRDSVEECLILEGNHELTLGGFTDKFKEEFNVGMYKRIDDILIHHGHNEPAQEAKHNIIGHVHPRKNGEDVFHYSKKGYNNSSVTIIPAFCNFVDGVDIEYYGGLCPMLNNGIKNTKYKTYKIN